MGPYSKAEVATLHILNTISGCISFISSLNIITMIFRSKRKLTLPYRRVVFALSCYDTISSLAYSLILPMFPSSDNVWGSMGNNTSCKVLGLMIYLGTTAVPMYNLSLCVFYVSIIIYSMKERYFTTKVEPFLHAIPLLYSVVGGSVLLGKGYFNAMPDNMTCWIAPYPHGCSANENVPCETGIYWKQIRMFLVVIPTISIFGVIVITMACVCHKVYKQEETIRKYKFRIPNQSKENAMTKSETIHSIGNSSSNKKSLTRRVIREMKQLSTQSAKNKAVRNQALLFVLAYLVTWLPIRIVSGFNFTKRKPPFFLQVIARTTLPLQGFMNFLIYTAPFIKTLRKYHPEYSWLKALIEVIKSGGDRS